MKIRRKEGGAPSSLQFCSRSSHPPEVGSCTFFSPQRIGRKSYGKFNLAINEDEVLTVSAVLMWTCGVRYLSTSEAPLAVRTI